MTTTHNCARAAAGALLLAACVLMTGCAAGLAFLALDKWFKDDKPDEYQVLLDGYEVGTTPSANGVISLRGAAEGDYLLTVAKVPELRRGVHATVHVPASRTVSLRDLNPFEGGVISGTVRRDSVSGPLVGNLRVVAIHEGPALLAGGSGPITIPQPLGTTVEYILGYTDASGTFKLGPTKYGEWLVTAALPGYAADVAVCRVAAGKDGAARLVLAPIDIAGTGVVRGTVSSRAGATLGGAVLTGKLGDPFSPPIPTDVRARVEAASGRTLPAGDWFVWRTLTALTGPSGQYQLELPLGTHLIEAFKLKWRATQQPVTLTPGGAQTLDFALPAA